jgi:hypothetical protein
VASGCVQWPVQASVATAHARCVLQMHTTAPAACVVHPGREEPAAWAAAAHRHALCHLKPVLQLLVLPHAQHLRVLTVHDNSFQSPRKDHSQHSPAGRCTCSCQSVGPDSSSGRPQSALQDTSSLHC